MPKLFLKSKWLAPILGAGLISSGLYFGMEGSNSSASPSQNAAWQWNLPQGMNPPYVPADNPMTEAKFQLGRHLFYDQRLSGNGQQACASCHFQHLAFTDGLAQSVGSTGHHTHRSAQSLVNVAYYATLTWANPVLKRIEHQDEVPLFADEIVEMGVNDDNVKEVLTRFKQDPYYQQAFADAFPNIKQPINFGSITHALATFQRGIVSADSKWDQVQQGKAEFTPLEEAGRKLFFGRAQCAQCHSGVHFSNHTFDALSAKRPQLFHNTGLYNLDGKGAYPDNNLGLGGFFSGQKTMGQFRTQSLRNVAITAPYMHDGSIKTLDEVLDHYARHGRLMTEGPYQGDGNLSPIKDPIIDQIVIKPEDKPALIAFLNTLTDHSLLTNPRFANPFDHTKQNDNK